MQLPSPTPSTSMNRSMTRSDVSAEVVESSSRPTTRSAEPTRGKTRVRPVRAMMLPETMVPDIIPSTIGSISSPAMVGEAPCTICMYSGRIRMPPNIAAPIATLARMVMAAARIRNSLSGIRAASPIARSAKWEAASPTRR